MKCSVFVFSALLVLTLPGCGSTRDAPELHAFSFTVGDVSYQILSTSGNDGNGTNYLVGRDEGGVILRARDDEQNGLIDSILFGDITVEEANRIYSIGIGEAQARGMYSVREAARTFEMTRSGVIYLIRTHIPEAGRIYNRFFVTDSDDGHTMSFVDSDADGILDGSPSGHNPDDYQLAYAQTIERASREQRIESVEGLLIVTPR
ncbi:MAG: hypothetical protein ACOCSK_02135 [Rhodothermales bacterium]